MLSVAEASQRILERVRELGADEVALAQVRGRILARSVRAEHPLPPWDNSAMDGFAVRAADLAAAPIDLPVLGAMSAGSRPGQALPAGATRRIMTGAPIPDGADAVVIREVVEDRGESARFAAPVRAGEHIRRADEDVAPGTEVLRAGVAIDFWKVAMRPGGGD